MPKSSDRQPGVTQVGAFDQAKRDRTPKNPERGKADMRHCNPTTLGIVLAAMLTAAIALAGNVVAPTANTAIPADGNLSTLSRSVTRTYQSVIAAAQLLTVPYL